ncbi:MAG: hypothetical protein KIT69_18105 [Propionibacteriaceae bacterium]|nr:hypothetical protein [Propionibacteriaceae bacterium]
MTTTVPIAVLCVGVRVKVDARVPWLVTVVYLIPEVVAAGPRLLVVEEMVLVETTVTTTTVRVLLPGDGASVIVVGEAPSTVIVVYTYETVVGWETLLVPVLGSTTITVEGPPVVPVGGIVNVVPTGPVPVTVVNPAPVPIVLRLVGRVKDVVVPVTTTITVPSPVPEGGSVIVASCPPVLVIVV